ncbi:MAG TPA: hypothetical protein VFJ70_06310 [Burkholderiales bacterium]|nr:hypothetical protein [Burkholderiales bacterium]
MSSRLACVALALALCGCAGPQWVRQDTSAEQADKDTMDCNRWAANEASLRAGGFYGPYYGPYRGWGPYGYRQVDEAQLGDFCMRARGYQRAP